MTYNRTIPYNDLPDLPPVFDVATRELLINHAVKAARSLAELKGLCETLPRESLNNLLINTIVLQESKDSSAIENIVTTQDELYRAAAEEAGTTSAAKEVLGYRTALYAGLKFMKEQNNIISTNLMVNVAQKITQNTSGIRKIPGTALKNNITGEIVYTPPCCEDVLREKLKHLELFINDPDFCKLDPIIKLALLHYQFESIHPFGDGNGRTGRILNSLYLVQQNMLSSPVIYLSSYIIDNKQDYYRLLREVTEKQNWRDWIMFMNTAVNETANLTNRKIRGIIQLRKEMEEKTMQVLEKFNNRHELYDLMFTIPYLKIEIVVKKGIAHRQTAAVYLKVLAANSILKPIKLGKTTYYVNHKLLDLITQR
jgi:Fic family protein